MMRISMTPTFSQRTLGLLCGTALAASFAYADGRQEVNARLNSMANRYLQQRAETIAKIQTRAEAERRQNEVRAKILSMIGGLPETRAALNAKLVGSALQRDGFRI